MHFTEIEYLLQDAENTFGFIKNSYQTSTQNKEVSIALKLKIKHFLENVKSSLDYIAYAIFIEYCSDKIQAKLEDHIRSLYFPVKPTPDKFSKYVKNTFPGLFEKRPDIYHLFEKYQTYNGTLWIGDLNNLVNKNKHRKLSKQIKYNTVKINHLELVDGTTLSNLASISTYDNDPISIDGKPLDIFSPKPYVKDLDAEYQIDFVFDESDLLVLPTLNSILFGANTLLIELKNL